MIVSMKAVLDRRFRISTQLYVVIGGAVALTVAASLVGWFSFNRVGEVQDRVNHGSVPELEAAFGIAQHSSTLVTAAPRLTAAANADDLVEVTAPIEYAHRRLEGEIDGLAERGVNVQDIRDDANALVLNISLLTNSMDELFGVVEQRDALRDQLNTVNTRLDATVVPAVDNQYFYTMTGYRDTGERNSNPDVYFSEREVSLYRDLAELQADANVATQLLVSVFSLSEAPLIEPLRERFEAIASRIDRRLSGLQDNQARAALTPIFTWLFDLGMGEGNGFDLRARELEIIEGQQALLATNRGIAVELVDEVDELVNTAHLHVEEATEASEQAILTGRTLLLAISVMSVAAAMFISWQFVWRILLRRLDMLSNWMRRMAGGDLEARVEIRGRDEVAEMAAALEVFRQHALEVQRLNLVEQLAEELQGKNNELESLTGELQGKNDELESLTGELQGKNDELESVLADLQKAQDQIVMREKLAALGELTAGVAHEIRNPLNFVNNFSEVSEELLQEMNEILEEGGETLNAEQRGTIQDITKDLSSNLERIRTHGSRANRIVHDMLMMGRGSGDHRVTDINGLVDEYSKLAYHSARATNTEFQLDLKQDFDPDVGELDVIPQDLGRVFLNMVTNSCHATHEKRVAGLEAGNGVADYFPTVWLTTKRLEDVIEVRIRDNGNGIPDDVIDKIFNPFFTTKPTDQGTGLGLAISSDIIRQHGGSIRAASEPGEYAEMIVELPLEGTAAARVGAADEEPEDDAEEQPAEGQE